MTGGAPGTGRWSDTGRFLAAFARDPLHTAAVAPSSPWLAAAMTAPVPTTGEPVVVELGPGTGAFTDVLQERLGGRGRHVVVELNASWADLLTRRHPRVEVLVADAGDLTALLAAHDVPAAEVIVSGLPWVAYTAPRSGAAGPGLHAAIAAALAPTGAFTQFAYTATRWAPPARRQLADLRGHFEEVVVSRTVWRNVPPAAVYLARRPVRRSG